MDIDLDIASPYGSVYIENTSSSSLLIRISNSRTLRELLRKRQQIEGLLQSDFGQLVTSSFDTKVTLDGKMIVLFQGGMISEAKRLYLFWQLLLSKLGI